MTATDARPSVSITIVTYNSAKYIESCLRYVFDQDYPKLSVVLLDNASADNSADLLKGHKGHATVICNRVNNGFAGGQNQAIAATDSDWVLTLNPDVRLSQDFVSKLVAAGERDSQIGTVCGKLLSMGSSFEPSSDPVLDSTGIYMTRNFRHLDRGSRTPDQGQFDRAEYVFGATGAAALYRRAMIDDISISGEFFDEDFFAYREDADVAWRAQLLGWKCFYAPEAKAWHVRSVVPENRSSVAPVLNMHSVKNRFLLRIKNTTGDLYRRHFLRVTARDLVVVGGCILREWSSLPAFAFLLHNARRTWRKRNAIMRNRKASDEYIAGWFGHSE